VRWGGTSPCSKGRAGRRGSSPFPAHGRPAVWTPGEVALLGAPLTPRWPVTTTKRKRAPGFRKRVLIAYQYRCAVCRFALNLRTVAVALDAAHIRWHQNEGPDTDDNGLALCSLHHKTFDFGAFTLRDDGVLLVSEEAMGGGSFAEYLLSYHGKGIDKPQRPEHAPAPQFLAWHRDKVFKGAARHLG